MAVRIGAQVGDLPLNQEGQNPPNLTNWEFCRRVARRLQDEGTLITNAALFVAGVAFSAFAVMARSSVFKYANELKDKLAQGNWRFNTYRNHVLISSESISQRHIFNARVAGLVVAGILALIALGFFVAVYNNVNAARAQVLQ